MGVIMNPRKMVIISRSVGISPSLVIVKLSVLVSSFDEIVQKFFVSWLGNNFSELIQFLGIPFYFSIFVTESLTKEVHLQGIQLLHWNQ